MDTAAEDRAILARATFLGTRLDVRALGSRQGLQQIGAFPLVVQAGARGKVVAFRFGAVVSFELDPDEEREFLKSIADLVEGRFSEPESETLEIRLVGPDTTERLRPDGVLAVQSLNVERMQTVAQVLAKSAVMSFYEHAVMNVFDRVEDMAGHLIEGRIPRRRKELLAEIGSVLLIQARTVGRAEVTEKPEITWDAPELDRLYEHLASEYELRDRDLALARKLKLISGVAETYLNLLHNRQSIRVEWYIVWLIVIEILFLIYEWISV